MDCKPEVSLVPVESIHLEQFGRIARTPFTHQSHPWPEPPSRAATGEWIDAAIRAGEAGTAYTFAVRDGEGSIVGATRLRPFRDGRGADLSYWVGRSHRGNGYGTMAAFHTLSLAFERFGVAVVEAQAQASNAPSLAVTRYLGMERDEDLLWMSPKGNLEWIERYRIGADRWPLLVQGGRLGTATLLSV